MGQPRDAATLSAESLPAGPRGNWLMGTLPDYGRDPLAFLTHLGRAYGAVVPLRFGPVRVLFINDPELIERVVVHQHRNLRQSRGVRRLRTLLGDGVVTSEGESWLYQRRLMQPAFHRASVTRYAQTMVALTQAALDRWPPGGTIELIPELRRLTLEIATETLFGRGLTTEEARLVGESLIAAGEHLQTRTSSMKTFIPDWLPTQGNRRTRAAIAQVDGLVQRIVDERRRSGTEATDLLGLLVGMKDEEGRRMSDRQLRDAAVTLMIAGHETTAFTLTWALYLLSRNPVADADLAAELADVLEGGRPPTIDDLPRLVYTAKVVAETLRLYPAGYITAREALSDIRLDGYRVKKGTLLLMSQWVRQRDRAVFESPEQFRPQRWNPDFERSLRRGDYFPFGMGPRQCIGQSFARLELVLALATMRRRYRFEPISSEEVKPVPIIALQPDRAIRLRLSP